MATSIGSHFGTSIKQLEPVELHDEIIIDYSIHDAISDALDDGGVMKRLDLTLSDRAGMGHTLYIGCLKSEVCFCCYEKNYEQYTKLGIPIEEAHIKNRFEIRLKDERAYYAVCELLTLSIPGSFTPKFRKLETGIPI